RGTGRAAARAQKRRRRSRCVARIFTPLVLLADARGHRADCTPSASAGPNVTASHSQRHVRCLGSVTGRPDAGTPRATRIGTTVITRRLTVSFLGGVANSLSQLFFGLVSASRFSHAKRRC